MSVRRRESSPERLGWGRVPACTSLPSGCRCPACDARERGKVWWAPAPVLISTETLESFQTVCTAFCLFEESCLVHLGAVPFFPGWAAGALVELAESGPVQQDWGGACGVGHLVLSCPFSSSWTLSLFCAGPPDPTASWFCGVRAAHPCLLHTAPPPAPILHEKSSTHLGKTMYF